MPHRNEFELLLLWTVTILTPVLGTWSVIDAQCRTTCLSSQFSSSMLHTNGSILEECLKHSNCSSCIYPCKTQFKLLESCEAECQEATSAPALCLDSCTYVKFIQNEKIGSCPSIESIKKFGKACLEACSNDGECPREEKCCYNGCGRTCQQPIITGRNYPSEVDRLTVTENDDGASATVRWRATRPSDPGEYNLYAVQARNKIMSKQWSKWIDIHVVDRTEISIHLELGRRYQFRIAAINQNGSLGFCRPSPAFHLLRTPQKPGAPENIESGSWLVVEDKINLDLHWDTPSHSDLPISKYRVFYSERPRLSPSLISLKEYRLDVSGSETSCVLPDLLPDMIYFVQVMAIARFGNTRLNSDRKSALIQTQRLPNRDIDSKPFITKPDARPDPGPYPDPPPPPPFQSNETQPGPPRKLRHDDPYWQNGTLKARLRWRKPKGFKREIDRFTLHWEATVCSSSTGEDGSATSSSSDNNDIYTPYRQKGATTHETTFEIFDLSFDCTYQVWVKPVYEGKWGPASASIQILTPPCTEVTIKGYHEPVCPTPVPDIPSAPQNMTKTYGIGETEISVKFSWAPPARSQHPLTGYRIYWARVVPSGEHPSSEIPTIKREVFTSVLLLQTELSYTIRNLTAGARYVVKLQALSSIGGGAIVAVDIKSPNMTQNRQIPTPNYRPTVSTVALGNNGIQDGTAQPGDNETHRRNAAGRPVASALVMSLLILAQYIFLR